MGISIEIEWDIFPKSIDDFFFNDTAKSAHTVLWFKNFSVPSKEGKGKILANLLKDLQGKI